MEGEHYRLLVLRSLVGTPCLLDDGGALYDAVEFMSQMGALSRLFVQGEWRCCNHGTHLGSTPLPATPAEKGADLCCDGFCSGRLPPSSEPGTMTPAICTR